MIIFTIFFAVVLLFGFVLLFGAPYLPTQRKQTERAIELLHLKKGQTLYELGCGDGRVLRYAAEQGYKGVGYELNPLLVLVAIVVTWRHRRDVRIVWGSFWKADLDKADGVYVFLLDRFMSRFDAMMQRRKGRSIRVVSFAFQIPGKQVVTEQDGLFVYKY